MFLILFFTIVGFLAGLAYVMRKRRVSPGKLLAATFLGLVSVGILKMFKDGFQHKGRRRYY